MQKVEVDGVDVAVASKAWVDENEDLWRPWVDAALN